MEHMNCGFDISKEEKKNREFFHHKYFQAYANGAEKHWC